MAFCDEASIGLNSIALHDAMVGRDDLVFCPAVYCYATYAEADQRRPLRFHDLPGPEGCAGATIGGTGIGISARCRSPEAAFAYLGYLSRLDTQTKFAAHHGQPALDECWRDPAIDARFGGCYGATRRTLEQSWIRPRYNGYLRFQAEAGDLIQNHLEGEIAESGLLDRLFLAFEASAIR